MAPFLAASLRLHSAPRTENSPDQTGARLSPGASRFLACSAGSLRCLEEAGLLGENPRATPQADLGGVIQYQGLTPHADRELAGPNRSQALPRRIAFLGMFRGVSALPGGGRAVRRESKGHSAGRLGGYYSIPGTDPSRVSVPRSPGADGGLVAGEKFRDCSGAWSASVPQPSPPKRHADGPRPVPRSQHMGRKTASEHPQGPAGLGRCDRGPVAVRARGATRCRGAGSWQAGTLPQVRPERSQNFLVFWLHLA